MPMFVRIKAANAREVHVVSIGGAPRTFRKERGWHEVPSSWAETCRGERMSDMDSQSPLVFDVKDKIEAEEVVAAEAQRSAGTLERPHKMAGAVEASETPAAPPARLAPRTQKGRPAATST